MSVSSARRRPAYCEPELVQAPRPPTDSVPPIAERAATAPPSAMPNAKKDCLPTDGARFSSVSRRAGETSLPRSSSPRLVPPTRVTPRHRRREYCVTRAMEPVTSSRPETPIRPAVGARSALQLRCSAESPPTLTCRARTSVAAMSACFMGALRIGTPMTTCTCPAALFRRRTCA